jgi:hypothetical protein
LVADNKGVGCDGVVAVNITPAQQTFTAETEQQEVQVIWKTVLFRDETFGAMREEFSVQ